MTTATLDGRAYFVETPRSKLRESVSVNLHTAWTDNGPWGVPSKRDPLIEAIIGLGVGHVRDAMFVHNTEAQTWYTELTEAGVGLLLFVPDARLRYIADDLTYAATRPWANGITFLAGRNEPNSNGGSAWPDATVAAQKTLYFEAAVNLPSYFPNLRGVMGPAVKHEHVKDYDADLRALGQREIWRWTEWIFNGLPLQDFHFYPGLAGPFGNAAERLRAEAGLGAIVDSQSETGWVDGQGGLTDEKKAQFVVEAVLRNRLSGIQLTSLYALTDDKTGEFGLVYPDGTMKLAGLAVANLLSRNSGPGIAEQAWWAADSAQTPYVATSNSDDWFTLYLLPNVATAVEIVTRPGLKIEGLDAPNVGPNGNLHWAVNLTESMHTLEVVAA